MATDDSGSRSRDVARDRDSPGLDSGIVTDLEVEANGSQVLISTELGKGIGMSIVLERSAIDGQHAKIVAAARAARRGLVDELYEIDPCPVCGIPVNAASADGDLITYYPCGCSSAEVVGGGGGE